MSHETANVLVTRSGTGWTVDVTACKLSTNTSEKDFLVFHNGLVANVGDYTKTTPTLLTFNGASLGGGTVVEIHRYTADGQINVVGYADRLSSADYNAELERLHRIIAEARINGLGGLGSISVTIDNGAYDFAVWSIDTIRGASRQTLANKFAAMEAIDATKAPLNSPALVGTPTAVSPATGDSTLRIANTGWAQGEFLNKTSGGIVTGTVDLQGSTTAITRAVDTNNTQLATTGFVVGQASAVTPNMNGTGAVGTSLRYARADHTHPTDTSRAPLASPTLTGTPAAPTAAVDTNTTQIATTAFVVGQAGSSNPLINGTAAPGTSLRYARQDHVHPTDTSRSPVASPTFTGLVTTPAGSTSQAGGLKLTSGSLKTSPVAGDSGGLEYDGTATSIINSSGTRQTFAYLASPTFTGTPAAPTAAADTNTTQIATTAYFVGQAGSTNPLINGTAAPGTSLRFARQDHVHPTDTSRAPLASPALTGTPTAPTATANNNTTQLATTAYCDGNFVDLADAQSISGQKTFTVVTYGTKPPLTNNDNSLATTDWVNDNNKVSTRFIRVTHNTTQSVVSGGFLTCNSEDYDTGGRWDSSQTFSCDRSGVYQLLLQLRYTAAPGGVVTWTLRKTSGTPADVVSMFSENVTTWQTVGLMAFMTAGETYVLKSGSNVSLDTFPLFHIAFLGI